MSNSITTHTRTGERCFCKIIVKAMAHEAIFAPEIYPVKFLHYISSCF